MPKSWPLEWQGRKRPFLHIYTGRVCGTLMNGRSLVYPYPCYDMTERTGNGVTKEIRLINTIYIGAIDGFWIPEELAKHGTFKGRTYKTIHEFMRAQNENAGRPHQVYDYRPWD